MSVRIAPLIGAGVRAAFGHGRAVALPVALVFAGERLLAWTWLRQPVGQVFGDVSVVLPGLGLLILLIGGMTRVLTRVLVTIALIGVSYIEYAFHAYFGRFPGEDEFRLATANPAHELMASLALYFSASAVIAAFVVGLLYLLPAVRKPRPSGSVWRSCALALSLVGWCLMVAVATPTRTLYSPVLSFATTTARLGTHWSRTLVEVRRERHAAPAPTQAAPDFDVLYLVGESLRADRFQPDRYARNTVPMLRQLRLPRVEFNNVTSGGDCTDRSMPLLMVDPGRPYNADIDLRPTLFAYAKKAGYRTAFVNANDNDWTEFVDDKIDVLSRNTEGFGGVSGWRFSNDKAMLPVIAEIANAPGRQFVVVETYAAHWPYDDRYASCPACRVYLPDLRGAAATFSPKFRQRIVNSYDNSVRYFDQFAAQLIASLRKPTLIVVTSDHGESLGERGMWGHCSAAVEQMFVPLLWLATDERVARIAGFPALAANATQAVSHASIFPTLLGLMGYPADALEFPYPPTLWAVSSAERSTRPVLVSPIGDRSQAEDLVPIDLEGHPSARVTISAGR